MLLSHQDRNPRPVRSAGPVIKYENILWLTYKIHTLGLIDILYIIFTLLIHSTITQPVLPYTVLLIRHIRDHCHSGIGLSTKDHQCSVCIIHFFWVAKLSSDERLNPHIFFLSSTYSFRWDEPGTSSDSEPSFQGFDNAVQFFLVCRNDWIVGWCECDVAFATCKALVAVRSSLLFPILSLCIGSFVSFIATLRNSFFLGKEEI